MQGGRWRRPGRAVVTVAAGVAAAVAVVAVFSAESVEHPPPADAVVSVDTDRTVNEFDGTDDLGAGIDGLEKGEIDKVWTPSNLAAMESAGFSPISYRLRTELGVKAWHWHSSGEWSDPAKQEGYWVSRPGSDADPGVTYGYDLPRRGNTIDQAKNNGYSRLTDGSLDTYWKSNPYLDPHFTKESDAADPQWLMLAFPSAPVAVDTLRIAWGTPYATNVKVQYWTGEGGAIFPSAPDGRWVDFPASQFSSSGGTQTLQLAPSPQWVQYVRVQLTGSSGTSLPGSRDVRDQLGFAVREVYLGTQQGGRFVDGVTHAANHGQTITYVSSTDPWHRAVDRDDNYEHASFDRVFASGLTNGKPLMVPVPVLYGVPEDAAGLLRYLRSRNYPVQQIEMGEEPDGQLAQPEHYAALYAQVASALTAVDPNIQLGGPGYQTMPDWIHWPDENGVKSWTGRFVAHLRERGRMADFDFFSFEWYPVDDVCADPAKPLAQNPRMLTDILRRQEEAGLPPDVPKVMTELGYSAFAAQHEVEMTAALFNAETTAKFLELGGDSVYFYGLEPNWVFQEKEGAACNSWGNLMLFQFFDDHKIRPVAAFHGAQLVNNHWVQPGGGRHAMLATTVTPTRAGQDPLPVSVYTLRRPDGRLAKLLLNKDPKRAVSVRLETVSDGSRETVSGAVETLQYSSEHYAWDPTPGRDSHGRPSRNLPPTRQVEADSDGVVTLAPYSVSVVKTEP